MKFQWRFGVAFFLMVLVGLVFLPAQNRKLFIEHWQGIPSDANRRVFVAPVTSSSPPIIQIYKAKCDAQSIENTSNKRDGTGITASMRKIVDKYPNDAAALAFYLRSDSKFVYGLRVGGPLASSDKAWSVVVNKDFPAPSFKPNGPFNSKAEYESLLALIAHAQKLEPQNTYFDWMMIVALLRGGRQQEAIQVVEKAWRKTDFNDHTNDEMTSGVEYSRGFGWEMESKLSHYSSIELPHISQIRETTYYLAQHTMMLRLQKRDAEALEWGRKCLSFIRPIRKRSNMLMFSSIAAGFERIVLMNANVQLTLRPNQIRTTSWRIAPLPASFEQLTSYPETLPYLAKQLNKPEVLKELNAEWKTLYSWKNKQDYTLDKIVTPETYWPLGWIQKLGRYLVMSLPATSILWLLFSGLSRTKRLSLGQVSEPSLRLAIWGGICGLFAIAGTLAFEMWSFMDRVMPLNTAQGTCLTGTVHPLQVLSPVSDSMIASSQWWLGIAAVPLILLWFSSIYMGSGQPVIKQELGYDKLAGRPVRSGWLFSLFDRILNFSLPYLRWVASFALLFSLLAALSHIEIYRDEDFPIGSILKNLGLISLVLLGVPALLIGAQVLYEFRLVRDVFQFVSLFLWRARMLLGGFIVAELIALAITLPIQGNLTDQFNQQFAIIEQRQTIQTLQTRGILPPD